MKKIFQWNLTINSEKDWLSFIKEKYTQVSGSISMDGCTGLTSVTFPEVSGSIFMDGCTGLTSVTFPEKCGYISMNGCTGLTSVTFPEKCGYISMDDKCSEYLLSIQNNKILYRINNVYFDRTLFNAVRQGTLSALEVLQIQNIEQRRVAYERLYKTKIADLPGLKTLDEITDTYGHPMRIITFTADGIQEPFRFLHCVCPSTKREYYLETDQKECSVAKNRSFGLAEDVVFVEEW